MSIERCRCGVLVARGSERFGPAMSIERCRCGVLVARGSERFGCLEWATLLGTTASPLGRQFELY